MRILHIITRLHKAAGTSTFCGEVCNQLAARGHDVTLAICNPAETDIYPLDPRIHLIPIASILTSQPTTNNQLPTNQLTNYTLIHIHGLWSLPLHQAARFARNHKIPVIWSTHGMTAPWAMRHKWWKKCIPWHLYQKRDLARARIVHCTSDVEEKWNRALGLKRTFVAPLGTFLPNDFNTEVGADVLGGPRVLLYVGRIYPVKALDNLIKAFAQAIDSFSNGRARSMSAPQGNNAAWILRIVGPDQSGHLAELIALCEKLGVPYRNGDVIDVARPRIEFPGPKYGTDLESEYANCSALALVSHTENFGATVVDAMAHGKPVITSTNTPWSVVGRSNASTTHHSSLVTRHASEGRCGWWVDNDVESLAKALLELFSASPFDLDAMGQSGRALVESQFTWQAVAKKMEGAYEDAQNDCDFAPCGACEKCYDTCSPERIIKY